MKITLLKLLSIYFVVHSIQAGGDTLKLLHVFSRHGARTPELKDTYPNDPYKLDTFLPMGYGNLTDLGKHQARLVGQLLRNRYHNFFQKISSPDMVYPLSTDYDRTKTTASLILTGMFSSSLAQKKFPSLITVNYLEAEFDYFLQRPNSYCPAYLKELESIIDSTQPDYVIEKRTLFEYLTNSTGKPIKVLQDVFNLYQTLTAETNMNLTLPDWTKNVYPEEITKVAVKRCQIENSTPVLKRLNGGRSLQIVLKNMLAFANHTERRRRVFLYTGHENNINNLLFAMEMDEPIFPSYSATVIFELHFLEDRQEYAIKVIHQNGPDQKFVVKQLKGCDVLCPLNKFRELTKDVVPVDYTKECESTKNLVDP